MSTSKEEKENQSQIVFENIEKDNENEFSYKDELAILYNWLENQTHLPIIDTLPMKNFLIVCDGDLEKAKTLITKQYEMRNYYKTIFIERDPFSDGAKQSRNIVDTFRFPGLTPSGDKVFFMRLCDFDTEKYNFVESVKMIIMFYDTFLSLPQPLGIPKEYICVCDMKGYTIGHVMKVNFSALRAFTKFYQEGISIKLKNIHVINCTDGINKILSILTPLLNYRVRNMIKLHFPNTETIFEYIPKEMFPPDYGGNSKSITNLKQDTWNDVKDKRDYLMDQRYWEIDESKKTEANSNGWVGSLVKKIW